MYNFDKMEREHTSGTINQIGFLKNLDRCGFNLAKSLSEILANSIDALKNILNPRILLETTQEYHYIADNGCGMDKEGIDNMFDMYRENHFSDESIGVSGAGAKPSLKKLSNNQTINIYTRKQNSNYLFVTVPWDQMLQQGKYNGMITIRNMTEEEKEFYNVYLSNSGSGTIIKIPYNNDTHEELDKQFKNSKDISNLNERIDCIFSKFKHIPIKYKSCNNDNLELVKYDIFSGNLNQYYDGITTSNIHIYKNGNKFDYCLEKEDGSLIAIVPSGRGLSRTPQPYHSQYNNQFTGSFQVKTCVRSDPIYFDYEDPEIPGACGLYGYDLNYFVNDGVQRENLSKPSLIRNGHRVGSINLETHKHSSARASGKSCLKYQNVRCEIIYSTNSNIDNPYDKIFSIQLNKNQLNSDSIPKEVVRLVEHLITEKTEQVWKHFEDTIDNYSDTDEDIEIEPETNTENEDVSQNINMNIDSQDNINTNNLQEEHSESESESESDLESYSDSVHELEAEPEHDFEPDISEYTDHYPITTDLRTSILNYFNYLQEGYGEPLHVNVLRKIILSSEDD